MKLNLALAALFVSTCAPVPALAEPSRAGALGRIYGAPQDMTAAVAAHAESDLDVSQALAWASHESSFQNLPRAWSTDAKRGQSRCFLQVRADHDLSLDECAATWFAMLRAAEAQCGSRAGALRALSSGSCTRATRLVDARMSEARYALEAVSAR